MEHAWRVELSPDQRFVAASGGCSRASFSRTVTCRLDDVRAGATRRVGVTVETLSTGRVSAEATVDSRTAESDPSDDRKVRATSVRPAESRPPSCSIVGSAGEDIIVGSRGRDVVCAGGGDDIAHGRGGNDTVRGGAGSDILAGGVGADRLLGEGGRDLLLTRDGVRANDAAIGGFGSDSCRRDAGDRRLSCP